MEQTSDAHHRVETAQRGLMGTIAVTTKIKHLLDRSKAEFVTCAFVDLNGNLRGHLAGREQFEAALTSGLGLVPEMVVVGVNAFRKAAQEIAGHRVRCV